MCNFFSVNIKAWKIFTLRHNIYDEKFRGKKSLSKNKKLEAKTTHTNVALQRFPRAIGSADCIDCLLLHESRTVGCGDVSVLTHILEQRHLVFAFTWDDE